MRCHSNWRLATAMRARPDTSLNVRTKSQRRQLTCEVFRSTMVVNGYRCWLQSLWNSCTCFDPLT